MKFHNVRIAFSVDYWDGPLDGVCHANEHFYWFSAYEASYGIWIKGEIEYFWMPRIFLAYSMSFGEYQRRWQDHREFEKAKKNLDTLAQWYQTKREYPKYTDRLPVGWFTDEEIIKYSDVMLSRNG